jgi:hypothetical protein
MLRLTFLFAKCPRHIEGLESQRQPRVAILHLRRSNRRNLYNIAGPSCHRNILDCFIIGSNLCG